MNTNQAGHGPGLNRRELLHAAAIAGAGLMVNIPGWAQEASDGAKIDDLHVVVIGPGEQGRNLVNQCLKIPGVRFRAICDIWNWSQIYTERLLGKYDQKVNVYADYRELLAQEKDLDAVIVATPDWVHAEQVVACLRAGLHVYCEKEMSNTLDGCRQMVGAARETGKLLQVGHQRRSNPRYFHALKMIEKDKILGQITHFSGQWNRPKRYDLDWPEKYTMDAATLAKFGYESMEQFRNWRWYRKFAGGPMADLGSHQVDVFNWFLKSPPKAVLAAGGLDYYNNREWYDNVMAIYEYPHDGRTVRGIYHVLNTTGYGGYFEVFMGVEGSIVISEDINKGFAYREVTAKPRDWEAEAEMIETASGDAIVLKVGQTLGADGQVDPKAQQLAQDVLTKGPHQFHLENFFDAIRNGTPLTCPAEVAFETAVAVLKANEAVEKGCRIELTPEDFRA